MISDFCYELHELLKQYPDKYCIDGMNIVLKSTPEKVIEYGVKENNFLQWHWGENRIPDSFFTKYDDIFKANGIIISFNALTDDTNILLINGGKQDYSLFHGKIVVKNCADITIGNACVWAFDNSRVKATGSADCLMYGNTFLEYNGKCRFELFEKAKSCKIEEK